MMLIIASGIVGFLTARNEPRIVEKPTETEDTVQVDANNSQITANTMLTVHCEYKLCRHTVIDQKQVLKEMKGLSFSQFLSRYPEFTILEFDEDNVVVKISFDCYCPQHYILKKDGTKLVVYRTVSGKDEQEICRETNVRYNSIDEDEKDVLLAGKVFNDLDEIDDYLKKITDLD